MTVSYLRYGLHNGFIHNWLSAGPQELAALTAEPEWWVDSQPVERGMLTEATFQVGAYQGAWGYTRCAEDHLVNQSGLRGTTAYLRSWAYTQLDCAEPMAVELRLVTPGPADVWINHEHVLRKESAAVRLPARLAQGTNEVLVRFETPTTGHYAQFMALQVCEPGGAPVSGDEGDAKGAPIMVQIPTVITPRLIPLRNKLEKLFAEIHLDRDVYERDQEIALLFPEDLSAEATVTIRLMNPARVIFADGMVEGKPGMRRRLNYAFELVGGGYQIELLPEVNDYYEQGMRIKHNLPLWTLGNAPYSTRPYGTFAERKQEALSKASEQKNNVYAELAKMALGWWKRVDAAAIRQAIARVVAKEENSLMDLAGLLGMVFRFADQEPFAPDLANEVMECALAYHYEATGQGAAQFLTATCETLAGQRWPNALFGEEGIPGQALYERGVEHITAWLEVCGQRGFVEWSASEELNQALVALSLLVDLIGTEGLQDLAMVVMDKIFFSLALNQFQGIHGGAQGRVSPADLRGGLLQATCPIARLMWGTGVNNHRIEGVVSLALAEQYEMPPIITSIAMEGNLDIWNRECHAAGPGAPVNKASYRTTDYLLASAQDYRAGERGEAEHIWQATLGPAAVVFTNAPQSTWNAEGMLPGFWAGNAVLPRVAQWQNSLVAIYRLPEDDWMGFTHAYFPTPAFDEHVLREGWAFARKGNGYLAITCAQGMALVTHGEHGQYELRASGKEAAWVCHMGRAAVDGDFGAFQEKIIGLTLRAAGPRVEFTTPRGEEIAFGESGPFLVNGEVVPLADFPHFENPFTNTALGSSGMDILYGEYVLRLDFEVEGP